MPDELAAFGARTLFPAVQANSKHPGNDFLFQTLQTKTHKLITHQTNIFHDLSFCFIFPDPLGCSSRKNPEKEEVVPETCLEPARATVNDTSFISCHDLMDKESISGIGALNIVGNSTPPLQDDGTGECLAMVNRPAQKSRSAPLQLDLDSVPDANLRRLKKGKEVLQSDCGEQGEEGSRKHRHNAKERLRRMTLHSSYLGLGDLLPASRRSKKRWSAPVILDRILAYIPELEKEIEQLTVRKKEIKSGIETKQSHAPPKPQTLEQEAPIRTVSVQEIKKGEAIIQICLGNAKANAFSTLLYNIESEGMNVVSASSVEVCDEQRAHCYHIHVQMVGNLSTVVDDCAKLLRDKIVSFLA